MCLFRGLSGAPYVLTVLVSSISMTQHCVPGRHQYLRIRVSEMTNTGDLMCKQGLTKLPAAGTFGGYGSVSFACSYTSISLTKRSERKIEVLDFGLGRCIEPACILQTEISMSGLRGPLKGG